MQESVLNRLCLVLSAAYEPLLVVSAKRALKLIFKGSAVVEAQSAHTIRTSKLSFPLPSVIRLVNFRKIPRQSKAVSRKNIFLRDHLTCQYCHQPFPAQKLTLDHVVPRSRGGISTWENLVTCCYPCNNKKSSQTPAEAGMTLLKRPAKINIHASHRSMMGDEKVWESYLFV